MDAASRYFIGEKTQCSIGIALAILIILAGLVMLTRVRTDMSKGVAWPFLIVGFALLVICLGIVVRSPRDLKRVQGYLNSQPEKVREIELPRMEKVMLNFKVLKWVELAVLITGMGLFIFSSPGTFLKGIGLGLMIQSVMMLGFDLLAEARGKPYLEFLQRSL